MRPVPIPLSKADQEVLESFVFHIAMKQRAERSETGDIKDADDYENIASDFRPSRFPIVLTEASADQGSYASHEDSDHAPLNGVIVPTPLLAH
jgi:hypothetical protein